MFGGLSFMVAGQMCCGVLGDELVVRVGAERFDAALAQPHVRPMDFTGRRSTGMVYVAQDGLRTDQALKAWVQQGVDYNAAHPRTVKPRTPRPPRRPRSSWNERGSEGPPGIAEAGGVLAHQIDRLRFRPGLTRRRKIAGGGCAMPAHGRTITTTASARAVWQLWSTPPGWPTWNPNVVRMSLNVRGRSLSARRARASLTCLLARRQASGPGSRTLPATASRSR
jgi:TfoX/Sxy family transcriptional regulator of competence genes